MSSASTCAWAFVFPSEHVNTRLALVSALQVLLALSTWQQGREFPWFVVHAWQQCPCFTGWHRLWLTVSSSTAASHWALWLLALVNPECSPSFVDTLQLWCSSCTHQKAGDRAQGRGLHFSLLIVSEFSVDDKSSSVKVIQLHLFLYLFKRLPFLNRISGGSSLFSTSLTALSLFNSK